MFKSIETYNIKNTSKSITGSGIITIIYTNANTYIKIDNIEFTPVDGSSYLFKSSLKIVSERSEYNITGTVGLFND